MLDYFVPGATVGSSLATNAERPREGRGSCTRRRGDQHDIDEMAMQSGMEGTTNLITAGSRKRKRKRTDELPCKAVAGKRIRKAARDPEGNEYVMQVKSCHGRRS